MEKFELPKLDVSSVEYIKELAFSIGISVRYVVEQRIQTFN